MKHYIFTRIALECICPKHRELKQGDHTQSMWGSRKPVQYVIDTWRNVSSLCYTEQTTSVDFQVVLLYSQVNADLLLQHQWPKWVSFCRAETEDLNGRDNPPQAIVNWVNENVTKDEPVTLSRIDADDSWSVDWFSFIERLSFRERTLLLYNWQMQYDIADDLLAGPFYHPSPMFSTIYYPRVPEFTYETARGENGELLGVLGNHAWYQHAQHVEVEGCYALMRFGKIGDRHSNIMSRFGYIGNRKLEDMEIAEGGRDSRFVGYKEDVRVEG